MISNALWHNLLERPLQILRIVRSAIFSGGFPYPLSAFGICKNGFLGGHGRIVSPKNRRCEMKIGRKGDSILNYRGGDDEASLSNGEFLVLAFFAAIGLIATINFLSAHI
jgi:hypothetical protein